MHVDDFLFAGTYQFFRNVTDKITNKYKIGKHQNRSFTYVGLKVEESSSEIRISQNEYISEMKEIPIARTRQARRFSPLNATEIDELKSLVGQLNWTATQTRPDLSYEVLELSIMKNHPQVDHLLRASKAVKKLKREENSMLYPRLGSFEDMEVIIYCDASWGNLPDGVSSAQCHIIRLKGLEQRCCPIAWVSRKVKRHVPSTLAAEALAMHDALDEAFSTVYFF